jgi:transcription initiation factor TFIID subunit 1
MNLRVMTNEYIEKRSKKIGINAHEFFKDRFKLSLKDGKFCIFEHVDQRPLFINNFGMASKLKRYVYSDEVLP